MRTKPPGFGLLSGLLPGLLLMASCQESEEDLCKQRTCTPDKFIVPQTLPIRLDQETTLPVRVTVFHGQPDATFKFEQNKNSQNLFYTQKVANKTGEGLFEIKLGSTDLRDKGFLSGSACISVVGSGGESALGKKPLMLTGPVNWVKGLPYIDSEAYQSGMAGHPWPIWTGIRANGDILTLNDGNEQFIWSRTTKKFQYGISSATPGLALNPKDTRTSDLGRPQPDMLPFVRLTISPTEPATEHLVFAEQVSVMPANAALYDCPPGKMDKASCNQINKDTANINSLLPAGLTDFSAERVKDGAAEKTLIYYDDGAGNVYFNSYTDATRDLAHDKSAKTVLPGGNWKKVLLAIGKTGKDCPHCLIVMSADPVATQLAAYAISDTDGTLTLAQGPEIDQIRTALGSMPVVAMAIGDVDGNHVSELAVARQGNSTSGSISLIRQSVSGWQAEDQLKFATNGASSRVQWIAFGNFDRDRDGLVDLAAAVPLDRTIQFFLNKSQKADPINCQ